MSLAARDKQQLYDELGKLLRSGRGLPGAIETMQEETGGALRRFLHQIAASLRQGATAGEAFTASREAGELERSVITAGERSGQLDRSCTYLSQHFSMIAIMRATIAQRLAYPCFILLLAVFLLNLPLIFTADLTAYLRVTLGFLAWVVLAIVAVFGGGALIVQAGRSNRMVDWALLHLPLAGKIRECLSVARFCATYSMSVAAGINVIDSLLAAGEVSHSALLRQAAQDAVPALRRGEQLSPLLARSAALPRRVIRSFRLGEETGGLDRELAETTDDLQRRGLQRVEILSEWLPRLLYLVVVGFVGYRIIATYQGVMNQFSDIISQ